MQKRNLIIIFFLLIFGCQFLSAEVIFNGFEIEGKENYFFIQHGEKVKIIANYSYFNDNREFKYDSVRCCVGENCNPLAGYSCSPDGECRVWGKQGEVQYLRCLMHSVGGGNSKSLEKRYTILGYSKIKDYYELSEEGVRYDSELFKSFFLLDKIPIIIEMRPTWKATYDFSNEERDQIFQNKNEIINLLKMLYIESTSTGDYNLEANVSKEVLNILIKDRRIGSIQLPIRPNTPYEFWFNKFPRELKNNSGFLLIFLNLILSVFLIFKKEVSEDKLKSKRLFGFVNLISLPFYFTYLVLVTSSPCGGGNILLLLIIPIVLGSLIWSFIYSIKYKLLLGKIISCISILILASVIFTLSNFVCLT
jgi:hypothetical protein